MFSRQQLSQLGKSIAGLGLRRLAVLGVVGVAIVASVVAAAYYLGRPAMQPIYTGLSGQDVARITAALAEEGIAFDVNEARSAVLVPFGQTAQARILLAQKGLPASSRAGYELFDQIGSIGLTSFMQEITRVRALEGEIARTIQGLDGVAAARVHLVLPEPGAIRRDRREPSASVVLRLDDRWRDEAAQAVRQIVAAAVPSLKPEQVNVASTDGRVLVSGGDGRSLGTQKLAEMERSMASDLEQRASRTLASALGHGNFQVSVSVRLDVDRQEVSETIFDPKSRVERSVKVIKQSGSQEDGGKSQAVGVESNIPTPEAAQTDVEKRSQKEDRREEQINYELNSKQVQTVREGYRIEQLAIAAVVNNKRVVELAGGKAGASDIEVRLDELKRLVAAATGAKLDGNDRVEMSAVDFSISDSELAPVSGPGALDYVLMNTGTAINAAAMLAVVFVVVWFGLRPAVQMLAVSREPDAMAVGSLAPPFAGDMSGVLADNQGEGTRVGTGGGERSASLAASQRSIGDRLVTLVESDDVKTTKVLKAWMQEA